jgi:sugar phosphate isomerase/epimerase
VNGIAHPLVAFSTLACPEWDAATVIARARAGGWDAIEWRGGDDGTVRTRWPAARRTRLRRAIEDAGLHSIAVTGYPNLISVDPTTVARSIAHAVAHAELAADLGAPALRLFLGARDDAAAEAVLRDRAIRALDELLERVRPIGVTLAIEPHDDHVLAESIRPILDALPGPGLGVVWDIGNAWAIGEEPRVGLAAYAGRIVWVQVKDGTGRGPTWRLCELGAGEVPLDDALTRLVLDCRRAGRDIPPISFEWERAWEPGLAEAATALPRAHAWLLEHLDGALDAGRP